jgi:hypothetical protein
MSDDVDIGQQDQKASEEETETTADQSLGEEGEREEVEVAQDHELKVLPENEEEDKEEILITDSTKRPSSKKNTSTMNKKQQLGGGRRRTQALPNEITKVLKRQTIEIDKIALLLQSIIKQLKPLKIQSDLIKQLQSQLRQIQKQMPQIQKGIIAKKQENKNKKKTITRRRS